MFQRASLLMPYGYLFALWILLFLLKPKEKNQLMIVIGSGGHTAEILKLLDNLRDYKRIYVMAANDASSGSKIQEFQEQNTSEFSVVRIPRSRNVHQSWLTTPFTTFYSLLFCTYLIWKQNPKVIVCNGPGTCVPICYAAFAFRMLLLSKTRIIFVESFARVLKLSLSGKLLYPIADRFLVQWEELHKKYPRSEFYGRLI
jgi:beta-1,4-N-acetylglucosaminyltransferase